LIVRRFSQNAVSTRKKYLFKTLIIRKSLEASAEELTGQPPSAGPARDLSDVGVYELCPNVTPEG
jgi:hypothetical protein